MITWITLIGGCRLHDDLERGKWLQNSYFFLGLLYSASKPLCRQRSVDRVIPFEKPWKDQAKRKSLGHPGYTLEADSLLKVHQKATLYETIK